MFRCDRCCIVRSTAHYYYVWLMDLRKTSTIYPPRIHLFVWLMILYRPRRCIRLTSWPYLIDGVNADGCLFVRRLRAARCYFQWIYISSQGGTLRACVAHAFVRGSCVRGSCVRSWLVRACGVTPPQCRSYSVNAEEEEELLRQCGGGRGVTSSMRRRRRRSYSVNAEEELLRQCGGEGGGVTPSMRRRRRSYSVNAEEEEELLRQCGGEGGVTPSMRKSYSSALTVFNKIIWTIFISFLGWICFISRLYVYIFRIFYVFRRFYLIGFHVFWFALLWKLPIHCTPAI